MSLSRKTIFELERRSDFVSDFRFTVIDLEKTNVTTKSFGKVNLKQLLNECIKTWPYREGASSIPAYASAKGFDIFNIDKETDILYNYELFLNLLYWAIIYDGNKKDAFSALSIINGSKMTDECLRCIEDIEYKLELMNYRVREITTTDPAQYVISKRDAQVDAVIEVVPELSEVLLSYLDVRNKNDEDSKKAILKAIADFLEDRHKQKFYKGTRYADLENAVFSVFNNAGIRHGDKKQWKLARPTRMKLYDQTFKAALHLLQKEDIDTFLTEVKELQQKSNLVESADCSV